jgi:hypothetical protein
MAEQREHNGRHHLVAYNYTLPDDAWHVELSEAVSAPRRRPNSPNSPASLPGQPFLIAEVPADDPSREPMIHVDPRRDHAVPFEVMRWFMGHVAVEVERCRTRLLTAE